MRKPFHYADNIILWPESNFKHLDIWYAPFYHVSALTLVCEQIGCKLLLHNMKQNMYANRDKLWPHLV